MTPPPKKNNIISTVIENMEHMYINDSELVIQNKS